MRFVPWLGLALLLLLRVGMDIHWHHLDNGLPDGDEAGHLGAIELYRGIIDDRGMVDAATTAFLSSSEYPPLFPLVNGAVLSILDVPGPFPRGVSALLAGWMCLSLLAVAWMTSLAERHPRLRTNGEHRLPSAGGSIGEHGRSGLTWTGVAAAWAYGTFPLAAALGRHTMLEPFVAFWAALSLALALWTRRFSRTLPTLLLGLSLAAGFMAKQTFLLYVAGPLALLALDALLVRRSRALVRLGLLVLVAAPVPIVWTAIHWEAQSAYGLASAAAKADVGYLYHILYYPVVLAGLGLGLAWVFPFLAGAVLLVLRRRSWLLVALIVVLGTLTLVPKKYPRLIVPALPLAAAVAAIGVAGPPTSRWRPLLLAGAAAAGLWQQALATLPPAGLPPRTGTWRPDFLEAVDPGCPQVWIRPPRRDDLGFDAILRALSKAARGHPSGRPLGFVREPKIPCSYETTFHYTYHLQAYARRRGFSIDDIPVFERDPGGFLEAAADFVLVASTEPWCGAGSSLPADWTPPPIVWRMRPLEDAGFGESTRRRDSSTRAGRKDICEWRKAFVPAGQLAFQDQELASTLFLYRRAPRTPVRPGE